MATIASQIQSEPTFHNDSSSKYFLPNDATERYRLAKQHEAIVAFMHGQPIHAPVPDSPGPAKVLDIGCGVNASMTLILAKKFPNATVYGVDLSKIDIPEKPDNVTFIQGNIHNLIDKDSRLARGSADYVFSRFMVAGVEDWWEHISNISTLLAPGGYVEFHEPYSCIWRDENANDQEISRDWRWLQLFYPETSWPPNDPTAVNYFKSLLHKADLEDVNGRVYKLGPSEKPEAKLWVEYAKELFPSSWIAPLQRMLPGDENRAKREEIQKELFETTKPREGIYFPVPVVWGRKGEN